MFCMFRCALLIRVLCGSVCTRTVLVYLTTGSMKYRGLRAFCLGYSRFLAWLFGVYFVSPEFWL